jgi:hypothetical protein
MWLLFHRKAGTKVVAGGRTLTEDCPTCQKRTRFVEVEVTKKYGLFFVDVLDDSERGFRCEQCHDVFDLRDHAAPAPPERPAAKTGMDRVEELAAEQRKRDESRAAVASKIDDELAELKRRMGR